MVGNILTPTHLVILFAVALLVLGPKRLPAAGRGLGEAMRGFKDALTSGDRSDLTSTQLSEEGRIMEANHGAGADTTAHATSHPTASSANGGTPSAAPQTQDTQTQDTREEAEPTRS